jgi:hypothetical protein
MGKGCGYVLMVAHSEFHIPFIPPTKAADLVPVGHISLSAMKCSRVVMYSPDW